MNPSAFHFWSNGVRGIPAILALVVLATLVIGGIALVLLVGLTVAVVGITLSACAALYYAVRRKLARGARQSDLHFHPPSVSHSSEVREIEVEVLSDKDR